jgi:hypothetical protein
MNEVYQKLIDRTRAPLDLKQVKTIFGFSHRPHHTAKRGRQAVQVVKSVDARNYDLTVFKVKWGKSDPEDLRQGRTRTADRGRCP